MIESRRAASGPLLLRDFDAMAAAARRVARGRRAPIQALNTYLAAQRVAVLVVDDAGCYIGANESACRLTGYTADELLDLSVPNLTAPEDAGPGERLWNSFVRSDYQRGTFTLRRKGGTSVRVVYHAYKDIADGIHISFLLPADSDQAGA